MGDLEIGLIHVADYDGAHLKGLVDMHRRKRFIDMHRRKGLIDMHRCIFCPADHVPDLMSPLLER